MPGIVDRFLFRLLQTNVKTKMNHAAMVIFFHVQVAKSRIRDLHLGRERLKV